MTTPAPASAAECVLTTAPSGIAFCDTREGTGKVPAKGSLIRSASLGCMMQRVSVAASLQALLACTRDSYRPLLPRWLHQRVPKTANLQASALLQALLACIFCSAQAFLVMLVAYCRTCSIL